MSKFDVLNLNSSVIDYYILTTFTEDMYNYVLSDILEYLRNAFKHKKIIKEKRLRKLVFRKLKFFPWNPVFLFILVTTVQVINDYTKVNKFTKVARSI